MCENTEDKAQVGDQCSCSTYPSLAQRNLPCWPGRYWYAVKGGPAGAMSWLPIILIEQTAVLFGGQTTQILSSLPPKRDCSPKRVTKIVTKQGDIFRDFRVGSQDCTPPFVGTPRLATRLIETPRRGVSKATILVMCAPASPCSGEDRLGNFSHRVCIIAITGGHS